MNDNFKAVVVACVFVAIGFLAAMAITNLVNMRYETGDLNRDGVVDSLDLSILLSHWSKPGEAPTATQAK